MGAKRGQEAEFRIIASEMKDQPERLGGIRIMESRVDVVSLPCLEMIYEFMLHGPSAYFQEV